MASNFLVSFVCVAFSLSAVLADTPAATPPVILPIDAVKAIMIGKAEICAKDLGIDIEQVKKVHFTTEWGQPQDDWKCLYACALRMKLSTRALMDENGVVSIPPSAPNQEKIQACLKNAPRKEDKCEDALPLTKCIFDGFQEYENTHKLDSVVPPSQIN